MIERNFFYLLQTVNQRNNDYQMAISIILPLYTAIWILKMFQAA